MYSYWDESHFDFSTRSIIIYENPFSFTEGDIIMDGAWLDLCKEFMLKAIEKFFFGKNHRTTLDRIDLGCSAMKRLK
jgi:hypothetical protein